MSLLPDSVKLVSHMMEGIASTFHLISYFTISIFVPILVSTSILISGHICVQRAENLLLQPSKALPWAVD
jgi:hypothetical protein